MDRWEGQRFEGKKMGKVGVKKLGRLGSGRSVGYPLVSPFAN